jgi:hypothetical protein
MGGKVFGTQCCGVQELHGINHVENPVELVEKVAYEFVHGRARSHYLINDVHEGGAYNQTKKGNYNYKEGGTNKEGRMAVAAKFIRDNDLGTLVCTRPVLNPVHGPSHIKSWLWTPHPENIRKFAATLPAIKAEKERW